MREADGLGASARASINDELALDMMQPPSEALINSNIADGMPILGKALMNNRFHEHYGPIVTVERNPGSICFIGKDRVSVSSSSGSPRNTPEAIFARRGKPPATFRRHDLRGAGYRRSQMTALVQALSRISSTTNIETETLKVLAAFCCAGLAVSLLVATYGVDLSPGFF